jgi:hypothetical protein
VLYDDQQYTRRDWRNRNRIKTAQGPIWLSIPVKVKGRYHQRIDETEISDPTWARRHWRTLEHAYGAAPGFDEYRSTFERLYRESDERLLSRVNRRFLAAICGLLGIRTRLSWSTDYAARGSRTERIVSLCQSVGASAYVSGPSARTYLDESAFARSGIELRYMDYSEYREYEQLYPPFLHEVSVLDLLFHTGRTAPQYLKSFASTSRSRDAA